jgi:hypothetical protein
MMNRKRWTEGPAGSSVQAATRSRCTGTDVATSGSSIIVPAASMATALRSERSGPGGGTEMTGQSRTGRDENWNPNIPAAVLLLGMIFALYAVDLHAWWHGRKFYSAERRKLQNVSRWWNEHAEGQQ